MLESKRDFPNYGVCLKRAVQTINGANNPVEIFAERFNAMPITINSRNLSGERERSDSIIRSAVVPLIGNGNVLHRSEPTSYTVIPVKENQNISPRQERFLHKNVATALN